MTKEINEKYKDTTIGDVMEFLETSVAMKSDLDRFATKEDLLKFATKEDLLRFATKEDLKNELLNYATRDEVREIVKEEIKEEVRLLTDRMDDFMAKTETVRQEQIATTGSIRRISDDTEQNTADIKIIKPLVGLS